MANDVCAATTARRYVAGNPTDWLNHVAKDGGGWIGGEIAPTSPGEYERMFTDGMLVQLWDGASWWSKGASRPHWRQLGDYPCWRAKRS